MNEYHFNKDDIILVTNRINIELCVVENNYYLNFCTEKEEPPLLCLV